jgi:hypothetical protein
MSAKRGRFQQAFDQARAKRGLPPMSIEDWEASLHPVAHDLIQGSAQAADNRHDTNTKEDQ